MRSMLAIALLLGLAPATARAEPPAEVEKPAAKKPAKPAKPAKKADKPEPETGSPKPEARGPRPAGGARPDLKVKSPDGDAAPKPGVDLFPKSVIEKAANPTAQGAERRAGTPLGKDGDWKVHAAQAGVMVGLFGALAALCGGGACAVPNSWTSWLPDSIEADRGPTIPDPAPIEPPRKAR